MVSGLILNSQSENPKLEYGTNCHGKGGKLTTRVNAKSKLSSFRSQPLDTVFANDTAIVFFSRWEPHRWTQTRVVCVHFAKVGIEVQYTLVQYHIGK